MGVRHHIVSRGYQRFFADGEILQLVLKDSFQIVSSSTNSCCVERRFNSYMNSGEWEDERAEQEWHGIESLYLPRLRRLVDEGVWRSEQVTAVKAIAALHWARSYGFRAVLDRIFDNYRPTAGELFANDPQVAELFVQQYGRDPDPGEIQELIQEGLDRLRSENALRVERMVASYNRAAKRFDELHVQLLLNRSRRVSFVTGDNPVVLSRDNGLQVGAISGLALLDADNIYIPIAPHLAAMLTTEPLETLEVDPVRVQMLNNLAWRAAHRQIIAHPRTDIRRSLTLIRAVDGTSTGQS